VTRRLHLAASLLFAAAATAAYTDYSSARHKLDLIEQERLRTGARVELTDGELTAYAQHEAPQGVRNTRLEIAPSGLITGSAMVDFNEVRRAQGQQSGWLLAKLLEGERPVTVTARLSSANGRAQVDLERITISGLEIDGATLDFLIQNVLLSVYPDAAVDRPFELGHRVDRIELRPRGVSIVIR
jgi:hypothetical protein